MRSPIWRRLLLGSTSPRALSLSYLTPWRAQRLTCVNPFKV